MFQNITPSRIGGICSGGAFVRAAICKLIVTTVRCPCWDIKWSSDMLSHYNLIGSFILMMMSLKHPQKAIGFGVSPKIYAHGIDVIKNRSVAGYWNNFQRNILKLYIIPFPYSRVFDISQKSYTILKNNFKEILLENILNLFRVFLHIIPLFTTLFLIIFFNLLGF